MRGPPFYDPDEWEPDEPPIPKMAFPIYMDSSTMPSGFATHFYSDLTGKIWKLEDGNFVEVNPGEGNRRTFL